MARRLLMSYFSQYLANATRLQIVILYDVLHYSGSLKKYINNENDCVILKFGKLHQSSIIYYLKFIKGFSCLALFTLLIHHLD